MPRSDTSDSVATSSDSRTGAPVGITSRSSPTAGVGGRAHLPATDSNGHRMRMPIMASTPAHRGVADVVLPCLDEAASLPWVLSRMPAGYRAIVADNGSTDGSAASPREHGAPVVPVPQRGFGAAAHAGLEAADRGRVVCFCDADGSMDPAQLPRVARPGARRAGRPRARPAPPGPARRLAAARPLANLALARCCARAPGSGCTTSGPCAPDAGGAPRARPRRPALRLSAGDGDLRGRRRLAHREVDVDYGLRTAGSRSKVTGTVLGTVRTVRDMRAVLAR